MEDTTGPNGFPLDTEMDPDNDGWFEAVEAVNYATAARERWIQDNPNAEPGTVVAVIRTYPDDDGD